jgi:hypothetical protein
MSFAKRSIATISVVVALSLETLAASATTQNPNFQQQPSTTNPSSTLISNQESPVLLAQNTKRKTKRSATRRPRLKRSAQKKTNTFPASQAAIETARNLEFQGRIAAEGCITNERQDQCSRLVEIKNALTDLCVIQQPSEACISFYTTLMNYESFLETQKIMKAV